MPWKVMYSSRDDTVVLTQHGPVSLHDAKSQAEALIFRLQKTNASRLLLDYSDAIIRIQADDILALPDFYARQGAPRDRRMAEVLPKARKQVHGAIFHQIVARAKGYHFALFETKAQAVAWLKQAPEP
jgi:hypothetical protein